MSPRREPQQANLFDLDSAVGEAPLDGSAEPELDASRAASAASARPARRSAAAHEPAALPDDDVAGLGRRLLGALLDLVLQALVGLGAIAGAQAIGVAIGPRAAPGLALLLLVFSLVYTVVPLAFWGRTPGMAALGLVAHTGDEHPLTFAEAFRRWLATLLTVLLAGLPALLALGGERRSLADRWSGSRLLVG